MLDNPSKLTCPICAKEFYPHRPNQIVCGSAKSVCKRKYKYLQRHGKLDDFYARPERWHTVDSLLLDFVSAHPATIQEVLQDESVPNIGVVRDFKPSSTETDLHSVYCNGRLPKSSRQDQV